MIWSLSAVEETIKTCVTSICLVYLENKKDQTKLMRNNIDV